MSSENNVDFEALDGELRRQREERLVGLTVLLNVGTIMCEHRLKRLTSETEVLLRDIRSANGDTTSEVQLTAGDSL